MRETYGNFTNIAKALQQCEAEIQSSCNPSNFSKPNASFLKSCNNLTTKFLEQSLLCFYESKNSTLAKDSCKCWQDLEDLSLEVTKCKLKKKDIDAARDQFTKCKDSVLSCKKNESKSVEILSICSPDTTKIISMAVKLNSSKSALEKVQQKISSIVTRNRFVRTTIKTCSEFTTLAEKCKYNIVLMYIDINAVTVV